MVIKLKKALFGLMSLIFLGLGFIGLFLPMLPTTPFLLLSVYSAMRSSERLTDYIKNLKIYKDHLESFEKEHAMRLDTKIKILTMATIMLMVPIIIVDKLWVKLLIIFIMVVKYTYFIFFIKTVESEDVNA